MEKKFKFSANGLDFGVYAGASIESASRLEDLIAKGEISFEDALEVIEEGLDIGLYKEVNEYGVQQIRQFLVDNHKRGDALTDDQVKAWVEGAEFQLAEGNAPTVEIAAAHSVNGYAVTYTVSDAGVSVRAVQH